MKFKKGNPITSLDDLVNELNNQKPIYENNNLTRYGLIQCEPLFSVLNNIENRNFFYAVEDDE